MCMTEFCGSSDYCNKCINNPNGDKRKMSKEQYYEEKIAKAKRIIIELVEWANWQGNSKCPSFKSIQDKAEQFLKEE